MFIQTTPGDSSDQEKTLSCIRKLYGPDYEKYVVNKNTGGKSGKKGGRYEDLFVAFKAAEVAASQVDAPDTPWPFLVGQKLNFVDDAVLFSESETEYFQLKNSTSVSWGAGDKSIADDFSKQVILAQELGHINPYTHLIVSSESLHTKLSLDIPNEIKAHTRISFFPYTGDGRINSLVIGDRYVQEILAKIICTDEASLDVMESALTLILAACKEHPEGASVEDIIAHVHQRYPGKLRVFPVRDCSGALSEAFVSTLAKIKGLCYGIYRGYFNWSGYGTSGFFPYDCFSDQFKKFQEQIVEAAPATFDDFEKLV